MTSPFLAGLRVVTLEQAVAAPLCSRRLAQAGADVIKVERPEGDFARGYDTAVHGQSAYFVWLNHGKRSVVLDFKSEAGLERLRRLLATADVVIQNLKPGSLSRAGIDLAALREQNPRLVTCSISGYPSAGPSAHKKAYDLLIQAEAGLCSITGSHHEPGRVGVSVCDIGCGMFAYEAILGALVRRGSTGEGEAIEVSLWEAMAEWMAVPYLLERYGGAAPERVGLAHPGIAPYGVFLSRDGRPFILAVQNEREWRALCTEVLDLPHLVTDEKTRDNSRRVEHRDLVDGSVQEVAGRLDYQTLSSRLLDADIAHAPVNEVAALRSHPDLQTETITVNGHTVVLPRAPGTTPSATPPRVPAVGEHTAEILAELDD